MLTLEPTGDVIWHVSRCAITLRLEVWGRPAHGGQAHLGINAFEKMMHIAEPLPLPAQTLLARHTTYPEADEAARGSMLVVGHASDSGANFNVVPGAAWFSIDRRFNPDEELDEEVAGLTATIEAAAARVVADVSVEIVQRQPSTANDAHHPTPVALARCAAAVEGATARFELCPGVLETPWYVPLGVPAFRLRPWQLEVSHGPDEAIDEVAMRCCTAVYALFASTILR